jgi:hypothetical protein
MVYILSAHLNALNLLHVLTYEFPFESGTKANCEISSWITYIIKMKRNLYQEEPN